MLTATVTAAAEAVAPAGAEAGGAGGAASGTHTTAMVEPTDDVDRKHVLLLLHAAAKLVQSASTLADANEVASTLVQRVLAAASRARQTRFALAVQRVALEAMTNMVARALGTPAAGVPAWLSGLVDVCVGWLQQHAEFAREAGLTEAAGSVAIDSSALVGLNAVCELTVTIVQGLQSARATAGDASAAVDETLASAVNRVLPLALETLSAHPEEMSRAVTSRVLLSVLFGTADAVERGVGAVVDVLEESHASEARLALLGCVKTMLQRGGDWASDAYGVVCQFFHALPRLPSDDAFWKMILDGLNVEEPLTVKRAMHMLQLGLSALRSRGAVASDASLTIDEWGARWDAFVVVYSTVLEFPLHLVEDVWPQLGVVMGIAAPAAAAKGGKKAKKRGRSRNKSSRNAEAPVSGGAGAGGAAAPAGAVAAADASADVAIPPVDDGAVEHASYFPRLGTALSFEWIATLLRRALASPNHSVRRWINEKFCDLSAGSRSIGLNVPVEFVVNDYLAFVNDSLHTTRHLRQVVPYLTGYANSRPDAEERGKFVRGLLSGLRKHTRGWHAIRTVLSALWVPGFGHPLDDGAGEQISPFPALDDASLFDIDALIEWVNRSYHPLGRSKTIPYLLSALVNFSNRGEGGVTFDAFCNTMARLPAWILRVDTKLPLFNVTASRVLADNSAGAGERRNRLLQDDLENAVTGFVKAKSGAATAAAGAGDAATSSGSTSVTERARGLSRLIALVPSEERRRLLLPLQATLSRLYSNPYMPADTRMAAVQLLFACLVHWSSSAAHVEDLRQIVAPVAADVAAFLSGQVAAALLPDSDDKLTFLHPSPAEGASTALPTLCLQCLRQFVSTLPDMPEFRSQSEALVERAAAHLLKVTGEETPTELDLAIRQRVRGASVLHVLAELSEHLLLPLIESGKLGASSSDALASIVSQLHEYRCVKPTGAGECAVADGVAAAATGEGSLGSGVYGKTSGGTISWSGLVEMVAEWKWQCLAAVMTAAAGAGVELEELRRAAVADAAVDALSASTAAGLGSVLVALRVLCRYAAQTDVERAEDMIRAAWRAMHADERRPEHSQCFATLMCQPAVMRNEHLMREDGVIAECLASLSRTISGNEAFLLECVASALIACWRTPGVIAACPEQHARVMRQLALFVENADTSDAVLASRGAVQSALAALAGATPEPLPVGTVSPTGVARIQFLLWAEGALAAAPGSQAWADDARPALKLLAFDLLALVNTPYYTETAMPNTPEHARRLCVWQTLVVVSSVLEEADLSDRVLPGVAEALSCTQLPSTRHYMDLFCMLLGNRFSATVAEGLLLPALNCYTLKAQPAASYLHIVGAVCSFLMRRLRNDTSADPDTDVSTCLHLVRATFPWLGSHTGTVRVIAQYVVGRFTAFLEERGRLDAAGGDESLHSYIRFAQENPRLHKSFVKQTALFDALDVSNTTTVTHMLQHAAVSAGGNIEPAVVFAEQVKHAMNAAISQIHALEPDLPSEVIVKREVWETESLDDVDCSELEEDGGETDQFNFQRKILPWAELVLGAKHRRAERGAARGKRESDEAKDGEGEPKEEEAVAASPFDLSAADDSVKVKHVDAVKTEVGRGGRRHQPIIVVASLIDKAPNLGGLARTCEIFAAECLVVHDLGIKQDALFKGVSVSASEWMPLVEVKPENIARFLRAKRKEGYAVVGLEQAARSRALGKVELPEKVVLLLGKEKEGIPVELIQELDIVVEIPQLGIIRSLNVHVSGALLIWDYTRQRIDRHIRS